MAGIRTTTTAVGALVLCEHHDLSALWAADGLEHRLDGPVDVVTGDMLGSAMVWEHRVGEDGATVEITLADGLRISGARGRPVLNRLCFTPTDRLRRVSSGDDRDYAIQEFQALFVSWLWALPGRMVNRPSAQFLGGHWRNAAGWAMLAARAGLAVPRLERRVELDGPPPPESRAASGPAAVTVLVLDGQAVGPEIGPALPGHVLDACRRLGELSGDALLGIALEPGDDGSWEFVTADPRPDLRVGGQRFLDVLARTLGAAR